MSEGVSNRLPFSMRTVFQDLLLITYEVSPDWLGQQLPKAIHPYIRNGRSFVSIVVGNLRGMRPGPVPEFLGTNYYQIVYRAIVQLKQRDGTERPGVFFLRSDGNDPIMSFFGNRLTEFRFHFFHTGAINLYRRSDQILVSVETHDGAGDLVMYVQDLGPAEPHPCANGFADLADEKESLVQLFSAYAFDDRRRCVFDLPIERGAWNLRRLKLLDGFSAFFSGNSAGQDAPAPCSLIYIQECAYIWKPMIEIDEATLALR